MSTLAQRIARNDLDAPRPDDGDRRRRRAAPAVSSRIAERLFGESMLGTWFVTAVLVLLCLLLVRPFVMSTMSWHRTASLLSDRRAEVNDLRTRHHALEDQLAYFGTDAFLAERAREYGLVRAGEVPYVIREFTRGETSGRFSLDHLSTHAGSFPQVPSSTRKQDDAIVAAEDAGTSAAAVTSGTSGAGAAPTTTATGAAIPSAAATPITPNT